MNLKRILGFQAAQVMTMALLAILCCLWLQALPAGAVSLPDGRVYEVVSPAATEGNANVYVPQAGFVYLTTFGEHGVFSGRPFEVALDGKAVIYPGDPSVTGGGTGSSGDGNGDEYLAKRSPGGGWTQADIQPTGGFRAEYEAFSSELTVGILSTNDPLTADSPPEECRVPYSRTNGDGVYHPALTATQAQGGCGEPRFAGVSADSSHVLFTSAAALTSNAAAGDNNLYDSSAGQLYLVNLLPDGTTATNASFGAGQSNVISADGSRTFWTDLSTGNIYVRENGTSTKPSTKPVSMGAATFWTATPDGRYAFYTEGERLVRFGVEGEAREELAGEHADVQGILGTSEDGSYVYFAAGGVLATNENNEREKATLESCERSGEQEEGYGGTPCNLYVSHDNVTKFVTTLSGNDDSSVSPFNFQEGGGDWRAKDGYRTAEVTPDGHSLVFMSNRRLTGYDNEETGLNTEGEKVTTTFDEVFMYEADTSELRCMSCNPSGEAPVPTKFDTYKRYGHPLGSFFPIPEGRSSGNTYQQRVISEDGSRVFFDSAEPLVPQDNNGWLDVYEWERGGSGSCRESGGCIYLLSGGTDPESSYLLGASASGDDVFIVTRAQLLGQDRNDNDDVYDARVGGVQPPPVPACSGTGCQGVPPTPPIFATPSSVTFEGVGNFPPPSQPVVKARKKPKKPKQCGRGSVRKHGKCVKAKAKRSAKGRKRNV
jgi:hypothetical protein